MPGPTERMAGWIAGLRYDDIPAAVIARIKLLILDSFGCALFATDLPWSRLLLETLTAIDSTPGCAVWGTGQRLSAPHAALVNGTLVQGFELDDVHRVGVLHVGAVTLPALLAAAEVQPGLSGRDLLAAAVAGYEIGPRVGLCMGPEHIGQGWHSGATVGVFSAVAGASAGLRLDPERTMHAIGLAATQSSGLMAAQYGAMVKRMHAGHAARSGLLSALLAARGFTGIRDVFEMPYGGFCTTFSRSEDRFDLAQLTDGLGRRWETLRIALKFYACVGSNHTTLDALRMLQARRPFGADDVAAVVVHGSQVTVDHVGWEYRPDGLTAAQLNLPYCVATLLIEGEAFVDQFTEAKIADPARMRLAGLVAVQEDPAITARGRGARHAVRVEVTLRDGTRLEQSVEAPRGSEESFAGAEDVIGKFRSLAERRVSPTHAARIVETVMTLEDQTDAAALIAALAGAKD